MNARLEPDDWIQAACQQIGREGVDQVKVEKLAKTLGVSKGSFYWHFADRSALLDGVLQLWERSGTESVIVAVEGECEDPGDKLWSLMRRTFRTQLPFDNFEAQLRAWAQKEKRAAQVVKRVDRRRLQFVTHLLLDAGVPKTHAAARADIMYRLLVGEFVLRSYGAKRLPTSSLASVYQMLLSPEESTDGRSSSVPTRD